MAGPLRLAGAGRLATGETVTWSLAAGRRGRRWRETLSRDGLFVRSLLLELAPDGRIGRLEVATASGLLTVHPSDDGSTLHGNVVTTAGVDHLTFAWSDGHLLVVDRSPVVAAALVGRSAASPSSRARVSFEGIRVGSDLRPAQVTVAVTRIGASTWDVAVEPADAEDSLRLALDERGLPILLGSSEWPLEP